MSYERMRSALVPGEIMLTLDFGTLPVQAAGPVDSLPDLVIVAHYKNKDDMLCHLFLDCVPLVEQHESKDWNFFISTLTDLSHRAFSLDTRSCCGGVTPVLHISAHRTRCLSCGDCRASSRSRSASTSSRRVTATASVTVTLESFRARCDTRRRICMTRWTSGIVSGYWPI